MGRRGVPDADALSPLPRALIPPLSQHEKAAGRPAAFCEFVIRLKTTRFRLGLQFYRGG